MTGPGQTLRIMGVTHLSDLYPNVRYKIALLQELEPSSTLLYDLGGGSLYGSLAGASRWQRMRGRLSVLWGHLKVILVSMVRPVPRVYVCYPATFLVFAFSLMPRRLRPVIIMDVFISLYDTVVCDRNLFARSSLRARLLFAIEKRALATASVVLVDTPENASYLSELFAIDASRFRVVPLSIPGLPAQPAAMTVAKAEFTCLFVGSMVPLQGVDTLIDSMKILTDQSRIRFVFIGDGQDSPLVEQFLADNPGHQLTWHRGLLDTQALMKAIASADLCLGIFGLTAKADRVLPYKLYYYAAMNKPFVSRDSSALRRIADPCLSCPPRAEDLAGRILSLSQDPAALADCARAAREMYDNHLSRTHQATALGSALADAGHEKKTASPDQS